MAQDAAVTGRGPGGADHEAPTLSVIIACLNAADTLGLQLEALADQSCPVPWELLLCDNGSTDASRAVAESFRDRLPELRVVDASAHRGAGPARNYGVQVARGQWVAFCDADDEADPGWLAAICRAMTDHRFVAGRFESTRLNSALVWRSRPLQQDQELQTSYFGPGLPHAGAGNLAVRRVDFLRVGGFDPQIPLLEDTDLCWRMQLAGVPLVFAPDAVMHVRLRATLRGMYRQGHGYGRACAMLEERYGRGQAESEAQAVPGPPGDPGAAGESGAAGVVGRAAAAARWLVNHLIGGQLFWRAGWVVGHRRYRTGVLGPAPQPLPSKVA